jgi:hypothetical protein
MKSGKPSTFNIQPQTSNGSAFSAGKGIECWALNVEGSMFPTLEDRK